MGNLAKNIQRFLQEEEGLTTVEYAIAGSLVALAVAQAFTDLGDAVGTAVGGMEAVIETPPAPSP